MFDNMSSIFFVMLVCLVIVSGCGKNEARVTITCTGDPINASVEGHDRYIGSYSSYTWDVEWNKGFITSESKEVDLYAEDSEEPWEYNKSKSITLEDGDHYEWSVGWIAWDWDDWFKRSDVKIYKNNFK